MRQSVIGITIVYVVAGYLVGSILFASLFTKWIHGIDLTKDSKDGNPGTANAFMQGGFVCGVLSLVCDMGKGFLPVYFYVREPAFQPGIGLVLVMMAPVLGHAYSIYHHFDGGKCIAVSFGVLLGLVPDMAPVLLLAFFYILFSILRIQPHSRRTFAAFIASSVAALFCLKEKMIVVAMCLMSFVVLHKHAVQEQRQMMKGMEQEELRR